MNLFLGKCRSITPRPVLIICFVKYIFIVLWLNNFFFQFSASAPTSTEGVEGNYKDWVFINYTFKRFEGLTQRGIPIRKWKCWLFVTITLFFFFTSAFFFFFATHLVLPLFFLSTLFLLSFVAMYFDNSFMYSPKPRKNWQKE